MIDRANFRLMKQKITQFLCCINQKRFVYPRSSKDFVSFNQVGFSIYTSKYTRVEGFSLPHARARINSTADTARYFRK